MGASHFDQVAESSEHDDGGVLVRLFDEARGLVATHVRHGSIQDNEIEKIVAEFFQRLAAALGGGDGVSIATQITRKDFEDGKFIIDDENVQDRFRFRRW